MRWPAWGGGEGSLHAVASIGWWGGVPHGYAGQFPSPCRLGHFVLEWAKKTEKLTDSREIISRIYRDT